MTHVNMAGFGSVMLGADFFCLAPAVDLGVVLAAPWANFLGIVAAFWEGGRKNFLHKKMDIKNRNTNTCTLLTLCCLLMAAYEEEEGGWDHPEHPGICITVTV